MPNALGLYTLTELENKVSGVIWGSNQPVDPTTRLPLGAPTFDMLISKVDLDDQINRAYTSAWLQVNQLAEDAYIRTVFISIGKGITQYPLPPDAAVIREIKYLINYSSGMISPNPTVPPRYIPMPRIDSDQPEDFQGGQAPPWHRDGNLIILDKIPPVSIPRGIRIRYVPWFQQLVNPNDTLTGQLARPMQEVVIYGAAIELCGTKRRTITSEMKESYKSYLDLLIMAAGNIEKPDRTQMHTEGLVKQGFSGRRRNSRRW